MKRKKSNEKGPILMDASKHDNRVDLFDQGLHAAQLSRAGLAELAQYALALLIGGRCRLLWVLPPVISPPICRR